MVAQTGHKFWIVHEKGERVAEKDQARYPRLRAETHTIWTILYQRGLETLKRGPSRVAPARLPVESAGLARVYASALRWADARCRHLIATAETPRPRGRSIDSARSGTSIVHLYRHSIVQNMMLRPHSRPECRALAS